MAYKHTNSKGVTYYLNSKAVTLRGGKTQTIYYFSKDERKETGVDLPDDRTVNENPRNGFLTLKRKYFSFKTKLTSNARAKTRVYFVLIN
jgi:hypothetical protein